MNATKEALDADRSDADRSDADTGPAERGPPGSSAAGAAQALIVEAKRRFLERGGGSPTVLGADTIFEGDLRGRGTFVVYGHVNGDGDIHGSLNLAASATWHGDIHAHQAVIAGHVTGSLIVAGKLEIGFTAVIHGRVSAQIIAIAKGAIVDGEIATTSGAPVQEFVEKRSTAK